MKVVPIPVGSVVVDSLPYSMGGTLQQAACLRAAGVTALAGYLGAMDHKRLANLLQNGLGFIPVTFAGAYNNGAADELAQLKALAIPVGTTVFLDVEGKNTLTADIRELTDRVTSWHSAVKAAGYIPGHYAGVPQPFTSEELWRLPAERYWRGQGSVRDRHNALAEPLGCGWCMTQMYPSRPIGGLLVDYNMVGQDYRGRVPTMVVAS